eukprot:gene29823-biopygen24081
MEQWGGFLDGVNDGLVVGLAVGFLDGAEDGRLIGVFDGAADGLVVGLVVGLVDEADSHEVVGFADGAADGEVDMADGTAEGQLASDGVSPFSKYSIWYPWSRIVASGGAKIDSWPAVWVKVGNTIL